MTKRPAKRSALRDFFRGYLHEDWPEEHETPLAAAEAFLAESAAEEKAAAEEEAAKSLAALGPKPGRRSVDAILRKLGGAWEPEEPAELVEVLERLRRG